MSPYSIYGITFHSPLRFSAPLPAGSQPPDLLVYDASVTRPPDGAALLYTTPEEYRNVSAPERIFRRDDGDVLLFGDGDQIDIQARQIVYRHAGPQPSRADFVEVRLLGSAFAWWFLRRGQIPFHAGAVIVDGGAVLFSALSGTGKSSLLCSLMAAGFPLHCDDFVAVRGDGDGQPVASSAYPQMRLWPQTVEQFVGPADGFPPVFEDGVKRRVPVGKTWGRFLAGDFPVTRIYLLEREAGGAAVQVSRLGGHEAFMRLLASITLSASLPLADFHPVWHLLEQMAAQVPVYQLCYPSGWQWLPALHRAVVAPPVP